MTELEKVLAAIQAMPDKKKVVKTLLTLKPDWQEAMEKEDDKAYSDHDKLINEAMAKFPKSAKKRIAIENASSASGPAYQINMNLAMDARLYSWNNDTVNAIKYVLRKENKI